MRRLSITARVALMCTLTTAVIAVLALLAVAVGEQRMLSEYYRDTLMSAGSIADGAVTWDKGRIEIDRDLDDMDDVRAAVYTTDGDLIYGREEFSAGFEEGMRRLEDGGWYVLDTIVTDGANKVWLRLYMSPGAGEGLGSYWTRLMLVIFPALVIISGLGGYAVAKRAVKPVGSIAATARSIAGGADLKKRIGMTGKNDELCQLANVFDDMLGRLDDAFERERRFTSDAAHELRTPVSAILAQSDFALSEAADDSDRAEAIGEIHSRALGMRELIGKLLALSRMDARQGIAEPEATDIGEAAEIAAEAFADAAEEKNISIHTDISGGMVMGDQTMLTQTVMNLVENAVRYGKPGGNVWITVCNADHAVRLEVRDDGIGMEAEQARRAFDRFYQADASRHAPGAGLGLSLTKRIVELHGGDISVDTRPGEGCSFTVLIPKGDCQ